VRTSNETIGGPPTKRTQKRKSFVNYTVGKGGYLVPTQEMQNWEYGLRAHWVWGGAEKRSRGLKSSAVTAVESGGKKHSAVRRAANKHGNCVFRSGLQGHRGAKRSDSIKGLAHLHGLQLNLAGISGPSLEDQNIS